VIQAATKQAVIDGPRLVWHSSEFRNGIAKGLAGESRIYDLCQPVQEAVIVEMVQSMIERACDGELTHAHMLKDIGILCGYVISSSF
jgi:hypothetical protein